MFRAGPGRWPAAGQRAGLAATLNLPARWNVKGARNEDRRGGRPGRGAGQDDPVLGGPGDYGPAILERLAFIRQAQAAGLTLAAIGQVLDIRDGGQPPCVHVTGLIARRLAELTRTRGQLAALAARAAAQDPADCRGYCSIIGT